jgi:hypothetical protein
MSESRRKPDLSIIAGVLLAVLGVGLAIYVGGYFALSVRHPGPVAESWCRIYQRKWQAEIYKPAAKVESVLTGDAVITYWQPPSP